MKKEYDKRRLNLVVSLNHKEITILDEMMKKEGWENLSGFIKDKLFEGNSELKYQKVLREATVEDNKAIIKNLMNELNNELGYLNYRFSYELEQLEKSDKEGGQKMLKKISRMQEWKAAVVNRTEEITLYLESIMKLLNIKVEKERKEAVRYAPDSVLEKAAKDWNDLDSPELHELVRRQHEELRKRQGIKENEK